MSISNDSDYKPSIKKRKLNKALASQNLFPNTATTTQPSDLLPKKSLIVKLKVDAIRVRSTPLTKLPPQKLISSPKSSNSKLSLIVKLKVDTRKFVNADPNLPKENPPTALHTVAADSTIPTPSLIVKLKLKPQRPGVVQLTPPSSFPPFSPPKATSRKTPVAQEQRSRIPTLEEVRARHGLMQPTIADFNDPSEQAQPVQQSNGVPNQAMPWTVPSAPFIASRNRVNPAFDSALRPRGRGYRTNNVRGSCNINPPAPARQIPQQQPRAAPQPQSNQFPNFYDPPPQLDFLTQLRKEFQHEEAQQAEQDPLKRVKEGAGLETSASGDRYCAECSTDRSTNYEHQSGCPLGWEVVNGTQVARSPSCRWYLPHHERMCGYDNPTNWTWNGGR